MSLNALMRFAFVGGLVLAVAGSASAATITYTPQASVPRTQAQGLGNYQVLDFFLTLTPGAEFSNYNVIADALTGTLADPARLQDDRQVNPDAAGDDTNTTGAVDLWVNTPFSSAGKTDLGTPASITANPAFYVPSGSGAAPAFDKLDWVVFDQETGDDNDLGNHPTNPVAASAPYHIARILASVGGTGTVSFALVEAGATQIQNFSFDYGIVENLPPTVVPEVPPHVTTTVNEVVTRQFGATDVEDPAGPFTFGGLTLADFTPTYGGPAPSPALLALGTDLSSSGLLTFDTQGFARGLYTFNVTATDPDGATSVPGGAFVVDVQFVPEPSTIALCGLAMVGMLGVSRRRNG